MWRFRAFVWACSAATIRGTCVELIVQTQLSLPVHRAFLGLLIRQNFGLFIGGCVRLRAVISSRPSLPVYPS